MHNRSTNRSVLNQSKLTKHNKSIAGEEQESIVQAWADIDALRRENKQLRDEIDIETRVIGKNLYDEEGNPVQNLQNTSKSNVQRVYKEDQSLQQIMEIQEHSSVLAQQIELESKKNRDLNTLLTISKEEVMENKLRLQKSDGNSLPQISNKIKTLEYQLEKSRSRMNESQAQINMFKEQINMARRERVIFSNVFKKLEQDIKKKDDEFKQQILKRLKEDRKREDAELKFKETKDKARDQIKIKQEEYERALDEIQEDLEKEQERIYETKQQRVFATEVIIEQNSVASSMKHEGSPKKKLLYQNQITSSPRSLTAEQELERIKTLIIKLKGETGFGSIDDFVEKFKSIDKDNDELYNHCNQKSDEISELQKKLEDVEDQTQRILKNEEEPNKVEVQENIKGTENQKKEKVITSIQKLNKQNSLMKKQIQIMNKKVEQIASVINVKLPDEGLNDKTAIKFISSIEQKIADILSMELFCNDGTYPIDRQPKKKQRGDQDKDVIECMEWQENQKKDDERIKSRFDLETIAYEAYKQNLKRKGK